MAKAECPHCHASLPANAVVCVQCGVDLRTGQPVADPNQGKIAARWLASLRSHHTPAQVSFRSALKAALGFGAGLAIPGAILVGLLFTLTCWGKDPAASLPVANPALPGVAEGSGNPVGFAQVAICAVSGWVLLALLLIEIRLWLDRGKWMTKRWLSIVFTVLGLVALVIGFLVFVQSLGFDYGEFRLWCLKESRWSWYWTERFNVVRVWVALSHAALGVILALLAGLVPLAIINASGRKPEPAARQPNP